MIRLPGGYAIMADELCYMVGIPYVRKDGKDDLRRKTYYTSLSWAIRDALNRVIRDRVGDNSIDTFEGLVREYERLKTEIEDRLRTME